MSKRGMGGGGSRGRRIGPMLASGRGGRTGPESGGKRRKYKDIDSDPSMPTKVPVKMKKGGSVGGKFPDLNKDGKVSQADVLKGRGVPGFYGGGMATKGGAKGGARGGKMPMGMMKGGAVGGKKKGPKGYAKGGKVRGAGIARKGVRPCKMR